MVERANRRDFAPSADTGITGIKGENIIFGLTGSIAAYKAIFYIRELVKAGANIFPVATKNALQFITGTTIEAIAGNKLLIDQFDDSFSHIDLPSRCQRMVICPATANTIAKIANGMADNLLTTMALTFKGRIIFCPAMNPIMYKNPVTQANIKRLKEYGHIMAGPDEGKMACGHSGMGRLTEFKTLMYNIRLEALKRPLKGKRALVTAGSTIEPVDPIRYISNRSTGTMGYSMAGAAQALGANTTLITGPAHIDTPIVDEIITVETAEEMFNAVDNIFMDMDILIFTAAVADFTPIDPKRNKIKKDILKSAKDGLSIRLMPTRDILLHVLKNRLPHQYIVGFCAETDSVIENARKKLIKKPVDMLVCNNVMEKGAGFGTGTNKVFILYSDKQLKAQDKAEDKGLKENTEKDIEKLGPMEKERLSFEILARIGQRVL